MTRKKTPSEKSVFLLLDKAYSAFLAFLALAGFSAGASSAAGSASTLYSKQIWLTR